MNHKKPSNKLLSAKTVRLFQEEIFFISHLSSKDFNKNLCDIIRFYQEHSLNNMIGNQVHK